MSDMEGFLGKVIKDSNDGATQLSNQMDGFKLLGQRQINIVQQEQINEDRKWIRQLEEQINKLKSELYAEKKKNESSNSGPENGWAQITTHDGVHYRNQSPAGYKKEVQRLQSNILSLNFSLLFKKINLLESRKNISLLSKYMNLPVEIINSTQRIGVIKVINSDRHKEFLDEIKNNENNQVTWFLNGRSEMFDLLDFNGWQRAFFARWLGNTYIEEEHKILTYLRNNPSKLEQIKELLGDTLAEVQKDNFDLSKPFQPSLSELKLLVRIQTIVEASRASLQRYQSYIGASDEDTKSLYEQAKKDILSDNLNEREKSVYELGLSEKIRTNLTSGNFEFFSLPNVIETKEDLDKFQYNTDLLRLEHRAIKKVLVSYSIKEREMNPLDEQESSKLERKYRDNDRGREVLEELLDLSKNLEIMISEGKFNYSFLRSKTLIMYCLKDQFICDVNNAVTNRENEYHAMLNNEQQKKYDDGIELLKCWLKHKDEIINLIENLDFTNNKQIQFPKHLVEPINFMINSKASIPHKDNEFMRGVKESQDPAHQLSYSEAEYVVGGYIKFLKSLVYQHKVSLVASENINIGSFLSKKYARDVYIRFEFDLHSSDFIKGNNYCRLQEEIKPLYLIDGKELKVDISIWEDTGGYFRTPHVIYYKIGQFSLEDEIKNFNIVIAQTPNEAFTKNNYTNIKPFNKTFVFNKKVVDLPIAPSHAKLCFEKISTQQGPTWKDLNQESRAKIAFTEQELDTLSEGLRKRIPRKKW